MQHLIVFADIPSSCIHHPQQIVRLVSRTLSRLNAAISRSHPSLVSPSPVRLRSDRLSLVEECIAACPAAYKQSNTLLDLASLLRVAGNTRNTHLSVSQECVRGAKLSARDSCLVAA